MPRQQGSAVVNNFTQGLVTEGTVLRFPDNACTDALNCVFDSSGFVTRRLGFDLEGGYSVTEEIDDPTQVFTEFFWEAVAGIGTLSFLVQQVGRYLYFYDTENPGSVSSEKLTEVIDLAGYKPDGTSYIASDFPCQYAAGTGRLLVVSRAINPLLVEYSEITGTFTVTELEIKVRDFDGLADGLDEGERPAGSVSDLITNSPNHYYNLLNQSWYAGDALTQWDTARSNMPSNRDYVALYREDATDAYSDEAVTANTPGSRPAPKGHFILSAWCPDREQAMADEGFTASLSGTETLVSRTNGTIIHDFGFGPELIFDGDTSQNDAETASKGGSASFGYVGKTFDDALRITKARLYGSSSSGYWTGGDPSTTFDLYGKQGTAPANSTDGVLLGTVTFTDTGNESSPREVSSSDTETYWDHAWVRISRATGTSTLRVAELQFFSFEPVDDVSFCTLERPSCVEFFAGRAWYAGIPYNKLSSRIYFTQIIQKADQFNKCYQLNDPTAEDFTDLLPDDGGVIVIPEIARVIRLFAYQSTLVVVATNGVWSITGGSQGGFLATDYVVKRLSNEGSSSPLSFMSIRGVPAWWGHNGIYTVQVDPNYQSFTVVNMSDDKIQSFYDSIPQLNRSYAKGAFDPNEGIGYWIYNSDDDISEAQNYRYDRALVVDAATGSFSPWTIEGLESAVAPRICGIVYVSSPVNEGDPRIKYTTLIDSTDLTYSEVFSETYIDWNNWAEDTDAPNAFNYDSYFVTGCRLDGQALRFSQPTYIIVYSEETAEEEPGSCFVTGRFDFKNSDASGRWSTPQQCIKDRALSSISHARLKIRGKGRALQLQFTAEEGRPFKILGWALWMTGNASL